MAHQLRKRMLQFLHRPLGMILRASPLASLPCLTSLARREHGLNLIADAQQIQSLSDPLSHHKGRPADFFEQLQTTGLLYPKFRLGYDQAGEIIDPALSRRAEWNRVEGYPYVVFTACTETIVQLEHVINMIPSHGNLPGFTGFDTSHVQWFLAGWLGARKSTTTGLGALISSINGATFFSWSLRLGLIHLPNGTVS